MWASSHYTALEVMAQRESAYQYLSQTTPENTMKSYATYTCDPATRLDWEERRGEERRGEERRGEERRGEERRGEETLYLSNHKIPFYENILNVIINL